MPLLAAPTVLLSDLAPMHDCLIAFGSNLGNGDQIYAQTCEQLTKHPGIERTAKSRLWQTQPIGGPSDQPIFQNGVIRVTSTISVHELHELMLQIEGLFGRERHTRWGPRSIDLDLLLVDSMTLNTDRLTIPHPRMSFRRFVLEPANAIASDMIHPVCSVSVGCLLEHLNTTPNKIVWVTSHEPLVQKAALTITESFPDWELHIVESQSAFEKEKRNAKLILLGSSLPFRWTTDSFHGPMLSFEGDDWILEISAAIEAMAPLS